MGDVEPSAPDCWRLVTVFGGSGFLGRRIVRHLLARGFAVRTASRHPERGKTLFPADQPGLQAVAADVQDEAAVTTALAGAYGAVNAVSLYAEHGRETFTAVHIEGAARIARRAREAGVERLVHVSGIGADADSSSPYIKARGRGELAVREAFADATLVRPAVMFGADDAFLTTVVKLVRTLPLYPMFGRGRSRLQPVFVDDVADAIARVLDGSAGAASICYEFGGPRVYTYKELLQTIADATGVRIRTVPVPFALWQALALIAEHLPGTPLTRHQVALLRHDTIATGAWPGLRELSITPMALEAVVPNVASRMKNALQERGPEGMAGGPAACFQSGQTVVLVPTGDAVLILGVRRSRLEGWLYIIELAGSHVEVRESYLRMPGP
ncbi:complex I NDUFA9 subunit family protein [Azospirillum sp. TSO22-1]|uniref:complex I NDUFA9 subunit family protein n=1 Tax=Azospirillum sp. TSO22-1 TaxID=716789 RepID=UPI000D6411CD|nr:complex I NDUFA9 subunit family protein [Azospirillum sp. TSO22-1]